MAHKQDTKLLSFGAVIQKYRKENGMSQPELAEILGVSRNTITNWENDHARPEVEIIRELCTMFNIPLYELFGIDNGYIPSQREYALLCDFRELNPVNQRIIDRMVSVMLEEEANERQRAEQQIIPENQ